VCFETTARAPLPPIAGGAGSAGSDRVVLEASDGNRFNAFSALATQPDAPGIMILPDARGLHPFLEDLANRIAESGVHATAMDHFGRTAGLDERDADFDFMTHVKQMTADGTGTDTTATIAHIRSEAGGRAQRLYSVGFCMGGRISFNQAASDHGLAGVIGFYGPPQGRGPDDDSAPVRLAPNYRCPVLGLFGGADESIPREAIDGFERALDDAGVQSEMVVYDGAPHSFFDRKFAQYREACDDAWLRMLRFVGTSA
jgi:carboxymethylenebutenolidase